MDFVPKNVQIPMLETAVNPTWKNHIYVVHKF
jgi:hypothetical protein